MSRYRLLASFSIAMASRYATDMAATDAPATPDELKERIEAGIPGRDRGRDRRRAPLQRGRVRTGLPGPVPHRPAPARLRRVRRRGRRPHPRPVNPNESLGNGEQRMSDDQTTQMREAIQSAIAENPVILFMKGTPDQPVCGFSARTVAILQSRRHAVRGRQHPPRPADPPGALGAVELADDPAAVRRRRVRRRLRHRHRDVRVGRAAADARRRGRRPTGRPRRRPQAQEPAPLTIENRL